MAKKIFTGQHVLILAIMLFIAEVIYQGVVFDAAGTDAGEWVHLLGTVVGSLLLLSLPLLVRPFLVIPGPLLAVYTVTVFAPMYVGTLRDVYTLFPPFDIILHFTGCAALVLFGFAVVGLIQKTPASPLLVALFAFGLSMALGVVWELLEFGLDFLFDTNTQRYATNDGVPLEGQTALINTMVDLFANMIGAGAMAGIGYAALKKGHKWIETLYIKRA